jgi:hypothetical protein
MRVRMISFGSNWWAAHSNDTNDPYRYSRNSAWFNSAGLKYGQRLRFCWAVPGQIRFNRTSGFDPEFKTRTSGGRHSSVTLLECTGSVSISWLPDGRTIACRTPVS